MMVSAMTLAAAMSWSPGGYAIGRADVRLRMTLPEVDDRQAPHPRRRR